MRTYRLRVLDPGGELLVGASLRCHDDADAISRAKRLALPAGRAVLTLTGAQTHEFAVPPDDAPDWPRACNG